MALVISSAARVTNDANSGKRASDMRTVGPDAGCEINYAFLFDHLDRIGYSGWIDCGYKRAATTVPAAPIVTNPALTLAVVAIHLSGYNFR